MKLPVLGSVGCPKCRCVLFREEIAGQSVLHHLPSGCELDDCLWEEPVVELRQMLMTLAEVHP